MKNVISSQITYENIVQKDMNNFLWLLISKRCIPKFNRSHFASRYFIFQIIYFSQYGAEMFIKSHSNLYMAIISRDTLNFLPRFPFNETIYVPIWNLIKDIWLHCACFLRMHLKIRKLIVINDIHISSK